jgi:intracellular sulfur oxidation DsrE/DsrF family protein
MGHNVKKLFSKFFKLKQVDRKRRALLGSLLASSGIAAMATSKNTYSATEQKKDDELRFPGDPVDHKLVYQFNKSDESYHNAVMFSVGAMLRKYGDNIHIIVVGIGPGIHIMAKRPERPVSNLVRQKVASLLQYGVEFHACGNTMKSLNWDKSHILNSAKIVEVGAADIMELQEQGYSYISW